MTCPERLPYRKSVSVSKPRVSIVTPVYNGESYLRECIESVLGQTYPHWDYTIANNCSTDRTLEIAREYAARDSRIRVHNNTSFVPVIQNYNVAFRQISDRSKYCKVVAADDWLFPECVERMVALAEDHPRVAIVGSYSLMGSEVKWTGLPYPTTAIRGADACRFCLLEGNYVFGTATSVLFRSDIIRRRHAFYNEANLHADSEACYEFLEHEDFGFVHQVLTYSRVRPGSLTSASQRFNTYLPWELYLLSTYGPKYLSQSELRERLAQNRREYREYFGREFFKRRGSEFWTYHKTRLAELGHPLQTLELWSAATMVVTNAILNPKTSLEKIYQRVTHSRRAAARG
jgi:glycosyltransferase involved in cell wall biosynthesis